MTTNNLNKETFVRFVAKKQDITQLEVIKAIDIFTDGITLGLAANHKITLLGFGVFYTQQRTARVGRNPKTGKPMNIEAYKQAMCRFGSEVKRAVNKGKVDNKGAGKKK